MDKIKIQLDEGAYVPERAHKEDAGADLRTPIPFTLYGYESFTVDTGVHVEIPQGYVGLLKSKSGLNINDDITSDGVIDAGFTGSIKVKLHKHGYSIKDFKAGDKITQLVIMPVVTPEFEVVAKIDGGERGDDGYGSTGR